VNVRAKPAPDSTQVPTSASISVSWSCAGGTAERSDDFALGLGTVSGSVAGESRMGAKPRSLQFIPAGPLGLATHYVAELRRGAEVIYRWSFTTVDGGWHDREPVTTLQGIDQNFVFGVNADGAGLIAYSEEDAGTNYTLVTTRRFDVTTGLAQQTQSVTPARYSDVHALSVAVAEPGNAAVAWLEYTGKYAVVAATQAAGQAWQPLETLTGPNNYGVQLDALAMSSRGEPWVLWHERPNGGTQLLFDQLGHFNPTDVDDFNGGSSAELALDRSGGAWFLWGNPDVLVRRRASDGSWTDPRSVGTENQLGACLAASADGAALALFPAKVDGKYTLATRQLSATGDVRELGPLDTEGNIGTSDVVYPALAMDAVGNALALWTTRMTYVVSQNGPSTTYGTSYELRSQRFDAKSGWLPTHDTLDLGQTSEMTLALDDAGNGFAVGVNEGEVRAARFLDGAGWQPSIVLGSVSGAASPKITVARNGRAAAIWRDGKDLIIRRFGQ